MNKVRLFASGFTAQVYCKTQLNKILMRNDLSLLNKIKNEELNEEDDWRLLKKDLQDSEVENSSDYEDPWQGIGPSEEGRKKVSTKTAAVSRYFEHSLLERRGE